MAGTGRDAVVVGGGIAGLAAACSLLRQGWTVTVLEQARRFAEVGAGLALTSNGLSALASLGLDTPARGAGHPVQMEGTQDHRGRWLVRIPSGSFRRPPPTAYGIHRKELHRLLLASAQGASLLPGARMVGIDPGRPDGPRAVVFCTSDKGDLALDADLVVGADGLRSACRQQLAPATAPRYSGKSAWRGVVREFPAAANGFTVRWGPGAEFGALRIGAGSVYWYGYTFSEEGQRWADEKDAAMEHFAGWAEPVPSLIEATAPSAILRHDVYALAPALATYVYGRAVLIGDAAHAMVPTLGQGANSSLEDGACVGLLIARAVDQGGSLAAALGSYDAQRRPRTQRIARRSAAAGRLGADLRAPAGVAARNALLRFLPGGIAARAGSSVLAWRAPA
ncbi:FAD-dependent oxidoreductase [uncultured Arthrobacter sp.]|uniref:FAD-dependent oxidoreductase n=1 Tax=uncultured Arthrobacter sp. TaxID=114050 RepID=UPI0025FEA0FC|nr:FAD-dependent oxidoreductase [uncultured Arthrobacter sp.]